MEPALEIRMVWENLALAMALWAGAKKGMITKDHLPTGNSVVPSDPGTLERVYNPLELRNEEELARCISNQLRGGVTFSAMQTQRSLEYVFGSSTGSSPLNEVDPDLRAARCSIYLLSTALSQGMLAPVWDCKGQYRSRFEVETISFVLDASDLDGKPVYWEDIGGLEKYLRLLEYLADHLEQLEPVAGQTPDARQMPLARQTIEAPGAEKADESLATSPAGEPAQIPMPQIPISNIGDKTLVGFLEAKCVLVPESYTIASDLYRNYLGWCEDSGQDPLVQRSFGIQLTKLGFSRKRRGRGRHWWKGLEAAKTGA